MAGGELKVDCKWHTGSGEESGRIVVERDADVGFEDNKMKKMSRARKGGRFREEKRVGRGKEEEGMAKREKRNS